MAKHQRQHGPKSVLSVKQRHFEDGGRDNERRTCVLYSVSMVGGMAAINVCTVGSTRGSIDEYFGVVAYVDIPFILDIP